MRQPYPSGLSDAEWAALAPLIPPVAPGGRPRKHAECDLLDALRYVLQSGIAWRALPHGYPPWQTAPHSFRRWRRDGSWERINAILCAATRERAGRPPGPGAAILDNQSAKTTEKGAEGPGRGQEGERAQAPFACGYRRPSGDRGRPSGEPLRPGRCSPSPGQSPRSPSPAGASVGGRRIHGGADSVGEAGIGADAHRGQTPEPTGPDSRRPGAGAPRGRAADPAAALGGGADLRRAGR